MDEGAMLHRPQRAPSPAPRPAARWAPAPRTPPSSPWGSWCRRSAPWHGATLHSRSFSLWGARTGSHSHSTRLCRERGTEEERSVTGPEDHRRLTSRGSESRRFGLTAAASARLPCCTLRSASCGTFVERREATPAKLQLCKWRLLKIHRLRLLGPLNCADGGASTKLR